MVWLTFTKTRLQAFICTIRHKGVYVMRTVGLTFDEKPKGKPVKEEKQEEQKEKKPKGK